MDSPACLLEARIAQVERQLSLAARQSPACTLLLSIPGIGLLTATALVGQPPRAT
jgi:transposase